MALGAVAAALVAPVGAASGPTVVADDATVERGERATVGVSLTGTPDGVAGFEVIVRVADGDAATITGAETGDAFGFGETEVIDGGDAVRIKAADVNETVGPGDGAVALGSVTLRGEDVGDAALSVRVSRIDDDGGERVAPDTESGTLSVERDGERGGDDPTSPSDGRSSTTDAPTTPTTDRPTDDGPSTTVPASPTDSETPTDGAGTTEPTTTASTSATVADGGTTAETATGTGDGTADGGGESDGGGMDGFTALVAVAAAVVALATRRR
ncbi:hypothetical protein [Halostella litorea]|uniref:hypothetical protein n=1 Tax=Halostella litorea TaxID=2528831 RepID=UPI001386BE26|nr:hypothetical protein [Halostella litorea]